MNEPLVDALLRGRRLVADTGPLTAQIVVIGEAGGAHEESSGWAFAGPSGWRLGAWLEAAGLSRNDVYVTNVAKIRPPGNKIEALPRGEIDAWVHALHARLALLPNLRVVVPTGNTALEALIGRRDITKSRGFVDVYTDQRGRRLPVVPTIHPAATFRVPYWERRCILDWKRIASLPATVRLPTWTHYTAPLMGDLADAFDEAARASALCFDIETWGGAVSCVGFAWSPTLSLTVPTTASYWGSEAVLVEAWQWIAAMCALPVPKVTQYGLYDYYWLAAQGITPVRWHWDTMALHHAIDAADDHNLAYMASIDLPPMPPWKHIPKDPEARLAYPSDHDAMLTYNGIDCIVQYQLADVYAARLAAAGRLPFYVDHYRAMLRPLLDMALHGTAIDDAERLKLFADNVNQCATRLETLTTLTGVDLRGARNKKREAAGKMRSLSAKKTAAYFYETLHLPKILKRRARGDSTVTVDEVAVRKIMLKHGIRPLEQTADLLTGDRQLPARGFAHGVAPTTVISICETILAWRRAKKLSEFLASTRVDDDGRLRSSWSFAPETGRLSSSRHPRGGGANSQNQDRAIRGIFVPDDGCVLMEVDLSQAEDRIVKAMAFSLTRNEDLLRRARAAPWENDEHIRAAVAIFKCAAADVTSQQRYIGKRTRHASNYDVGGARLADELLKDGITITPAEGAQMISAIVDVDTPEVRVWQAEIRARVMRDRRLDNSWGRELLFTYDRLDDDTYRRGYAFIPQSEVPGIVNQYGHIPLARAIRRGDFRAAINVNGHDSLLLSVHPDDVWYVWEFLRTSLERPRVYWGVELTIPVELAVGRTWAFAPGTRFKRPPTRDALVAAVEALR